MQQLRVEARTTKPGLPRNATALRLGVNPDALRGWIKHADIHAGRAPQTTSTDAVRLKELKREVRELKRGAHGAAVLNRPEV